MYLLTSKRSGSRVDGMVSTCELSINVVKVNKLKRLASLSQKGTVAGKGAHFSLFMGTKRYRRIESILTRSCHPDETW